MPFAKIARKAMYLLAFAVLGARAATVATVGDAEYGTLGEAVGAAPSGSTVAVRDDIRLDTTLTVEGKVLTLDLNGKTLTVATEGDGIVVQDATLNLGNSGGTGKYVFECTASGSDGIFLHNTREDGVSTLNIDSDVEISFKPGVNSAIHAYGEAGTAVVNMNAGGICAKGEGQQVSAVIVDQNAAFNMKGGTFDLSVDFDTFSQNNDVVGVLVWGQNGVQKNGTVKIEGGLFNVGGKNAFAQAIQVGMKNGKSENISVEISGGEIVLSPSGDGEGYVFTPYNAAYASATMSGGRIRGTVTALTATASGTDTANMTVSGGTFPFEVKESYCADGFTVKVTTDADGNTVYGVVEEVVAATIGGTAYETLDEAIKAVQDGETIVVNAGEYKLNGSLAYTGKAFTIQAAEGAKVSFDMSGAVALHGAKITFTGVTFDYKTNGNYIGLQHTDTLVYNDCTVNGMVFLYAASETFNRCTFNQTDAGAYNVWTYGAKEVAFNACTFNCVGKAVLVYNEGTNTKTDLAVSDCAFKASAPVEGKAAIEIDTSMMAGGATITVDAKTTAEGFAEGSNSKSTLWNDKKQTQDTNKNTTVTVAGETVFTPVVAQVGTTGYTTLVAALAALSAENHTLTLLNEDVWDAATPVYWAAGAQNGYAATFADALTAAYKANAGAITVVCRPGADVGKMTHGHVADDLTVYGNNAYLSDGECDLEVDTYTFSRATGAYAADGVSLDKDITITAYELDNLGVWGQRTTDHTVTVNLTDCDSVQGVTAQRVYISGTTGVNNITLTGCDFLTKATAVYSNADGAITVKDCSFTGGAAPVNVNHKADGAVSVTVEGCTFTDCGDDGDWKQFAAPIRFVNSGAGTMSASVATTTISGTVGTNGDILLGDGRTGQKSNDVTLTVTDTAADVQAQKPGYYDGETVDGTKAATAASPASGTLETSVAKLLPNSVAQVGEVKYATLAEAVAAAQAGDTVTLLDDTVVANVVLGKSLTLDLNGKTVSSKSGAKVLTVTAGTVTVKNGTVQAGTVVNGGSRDSNPAIYVTVGQSATEKEITLTLENMTVLGIENQKRGVTAETVSDLVAGGMYKYQVTAGTAVEISSQYDTAITVNVKNSTIRGGKGAATEGTVTDYLSGGANQADGGVGIYARGENLTLNLTEGSKVFGGDSDTKNAGKALELQKCASVVISDSTVQGGNSHGCGSYGIGGAAVLVAKNCGAINVKIEKSTLQGGDGGASWDGSGVELNNKAATVTITDSTVKSGRGENATGNAAAITLPNWDNADLTLSNVSLSGSDKNTVIKNGLYSDITLAGDVTVDAGTLKNVAISELGENVSIKIAEGAAAEADTIVSLDPDRALVKDSDVLFRSDVAVAQVVDSQGNKMSYATLASAIEAAADGETVKLLADVTEADALNAGIVYDITGVTLDLNGHTYSQNNFAHVFQGTGGVIKNGKMVCLNGGSYALFIGDDPKTTGFTVEDVELTGGINIYNASGVVLRNLTVNGSNYYAVWLDGDASATIESGTYTAGAQGVLNGAESSELAVSGGVFTTNGKPLMGTSGGTLQISGGQFDTVVDEAYCAAGFIPTKNADGTYGVKKGTYVAQVGTTKYDTLEGAIEATVAAGQAVELLDDVVVTDFTLNVGVTIRSADETRHEIKGLKAISGTGVTLENVYLNLDQTLDIGGTDTTLKNCVMRAKDVGYDDVAKGGTTGFTGGKPWTDGAGSYLVRVTGTNVALTDCLFDGTDKNEEYFPNMCLAPVSGTDVTMTRCTFNEGFGACYYSTPHGTWTLDGCKFTKVYCYNIQAGDTAANIVVKNCELAGWTSFGSDMASVSFEKCSFAKSSGYATIVAYKDVTFTDCSFTEDYKDSLYIEADTVAELTGCTVVDADGNASTTVSLADLANPEKDTGFAAIDATKNEDGKYTAGRFVGKEDTIRTAIAEGYALTVGDDGSYTLDTAVAQIGTKGYASLAEAFAAAKDGDTVTVLADVTVAEQLVVEKALTLDLGGKTVTSTYAIPATVSSGADRYALLTKAAVTVKNGTFAAGQARALGAYADLTLTDATITSALTGGHCCVAFCAAGGTYTVADTTITGDYAVANFADNATIAITDSVLEGSGCGLYHNGTNYGLKLTVTDTTINGAIDQAIGEGKDPSGVYLSGSLDALANAANQNGANGRHQATFTRCTIKGNTGIEVKYTDLTLEDCTVVATTKDPSYTQNNNGMTALGFAVVSTDNAKGETTPKPEGTITITGANGSYTGRVGLGSLDSVKTDFADFTDADYAVSGGTFSDAVLPEYCASGYIPTANDDGTYGVKEGTYVAQIGTTGYETLEAALAAADAGATVKMLTDVVLTEKQTIAKALVLDLNGKVISSTVDQFITIANGGDLTVNDATGEGRIENTTTEFWGGTILMTGGVLTLNGGTLAANTATGAYSPVIAVKSSATINVAGGRIEANRTGSVNAIQLGQNADATLNVTGGTIFGGKIGVYSYQRTGSVSVGNVVNVSGGEIIGKSGNAVYAAAKTGLSISGGTLTPGGSAAAIGIGGGDCTVTIGREGGVVDDVTIPSVDVGSRTATVKLLSGKVGMFKNWTSMTVEKVSQGKDKLLVGTDITASLPGSDLLCQLDAESGLYEIVKLTVENAVAIVTHDGTETPYRTVEQAVRAVADGDTLTLKVDHTGSQSLSFSAKNVTVDLGGKTLTYTGATGGLSSALSFNQSTTSDNTVTVKNGTIVAKAQDATCVRAEMKGDLSKTLTVVFGENLTLTSGNTSRYGGVVLGTGARTASPCEKMTKGGLLVTEGEKQWIYGETETAFTHANGTEVTLLNDWYCTDYNGAIKVPDTSAFGSAKLNLDRHTIKHYGAGAAIVMGNDAKPSEGTAAKTLEISNGTIKTSQYGAAVCGSNKSLTLDGVTLTTTGDKMFGLYANGMTSGNTVTLKNGSAVVSEKATGIYFPGAGTLTVEDSYVTGGMSGIEVRAGVLNVSGTSVVESTAEEFNFTNDDNGITTTGAAVAAVKHTVGSDLAVTITGGTFKGPCGFYANDPNDDKSGTVTVSISGGAFSTDVEKDYLADDCKTVQQTIDGTLYYVVGPAITQIEVSLGDVKKLLPFADAWLAEKIGTDASGWTTAALEAEAANGLKKWQCYLFGLNPSDATAKIVATAKQGTVESIPLTVANADASASPLVTDGLVTVTYVLMGSDDNATWAAQGAEVATPDGLAIPLTGTTYKFYRVDVKVTSAESAEGN